MALRMAETSEQGFTGTWYACTAPACWNAHLQPSEELLAQLAEQGTHRGTITITHTRADGTLLEGSRKGDGVWEIVRPHQFTWGRSLPGVLFIRHSRDKRADHWSIRRAAEALRAAGWTVEIRVDEDTRRSFAEAEADRVARSAARAERFQGYAGNAADRSAAAHATARRIADGIPLGQPILLGHHSQRRAERDRDRIWSNTEKGVKEADKAEYLARRAAASASYEEFRKNPGVTLRRIAKLEADLRRVHRQIAAETQHGDGSEKASAWVAELNRRKAELEEEIAYWRQVIAEAEADGFKVWGKADFAKGDFVEYRGTWYEVLRVNARSVTIPHIHNGIGRAVVRKGDGHLDWTWTAPYDGVTGRKSAEEMQQQLDAARDKAAE
nr:DUF3560 domain-containing protein [Streptomyces sp. SID5468]